MTPHSPLSARFVTRLTGLITACAIGVAIPCVIAAQALPEAPDYHPSFDPERFKGSPAGSPNRVVVLGTPHLIGLPKSFTPEMLSPLLDRLTAWRPTAIATEDLSGLQCDTLRRYPSRYAETVQYYCTDPAPASRATGLDVPAANAEAERLLATWPANPKAAQRRHLAAIFLAAGERGSALVQWLRLPPGERKAGDGLTDELVASLDSFKDRRNETCLISATLAARLGLERLWSMDDHSADAPDSSDPAEQKAAADAISHAWDNPATQALKTEDDRLDMALAQPGGLLALYRADNAPDRAEQVYHSDFGAALVEPSRQQFGRGYVGYWETRNLRMAGNIRDVLGRYPGTRMLVIVGAAHKGYLESYLDEMHDVRLADAEAMLR